MQNNRQTNHRVAQRWWTCDRCGFPYNESKVVTRRGLILCTGESTNKCGEDHYGHEFYLSRLETPYEKVPDNPPDVPWDDL